jgi:8-oxo-dGTP diphosphatase
MSGPIVRAAGGVVYSYDPEGALTLLLIRDRHNAWTLPKGHLEAGEDDEGAAVREIAEETGITCVIERPIARVRYPVYKRGVWRDKEVAYFLARARHLPPIPAEDEGIVVAAWVSPRTALSTLTYRQVRGVVEKALVILKA